MKVLAWESYGSLTLYSLQNEKDCHYLYVSIKRIVEKEGFLYEGEPNLDDLISWTKCEHITRDWEIFDKLEILELKENYDAKTIHF